MTNFFVEKYIIPSAKGSGAYKVSRLLNEDNNDEFPILGSSRAEGSIYPDSIGSNFFNYGLAGVQDNVWIFFLEKELKKSSTSPILINFDLDGLGYDNGDVSYWISNSTNKEIRIFFDKWSPTYLIPTIKHFSYFEKYIVNIIQEKISLTAIINNGAILEKKVLLPSEFEKLVNQRNKSKIYFKNDASLHNNLFTLLKQNSKREIIFFIPPYHESYLKSIKNFDSIAVFLDALDDFSKVTVLDYSQFKFSQNLYFNTTHLNYDGALKFTKILKKDLMDKGFIKKVGLLK